MEEKLRCVIVANGEFPTHSIPLESLRNTNFIVACDGAGNSLLDFGVNPDVIIGDLDSFQGNNYDRVKIIKIQEQMSNDLSKAFNYVLSLNFNEIIILGAGGKRDDHAIANIFLLESYSDLKNKDGSTPLVRIQTNFGEFQCFQGDFICKCKIGADVSLFCSDKTIKFNSTNLEYPLNNFSFNNLSNGTLNKALNHFFKIYSNNQDSKMIVFIAF